MVSTGNKRYIYMIIISIISLVATVICFINTNSLPDSFKSLAFLPLGNTIVSAAFVGALVKGDYYFDFPSIVITSLFTVRNAITPMVMSLTTCTSRLGIYNNSKMVNIAIVVFIYEMLAVYIYMYVVRNKPLKRRLRIIFHSQTPKGTFAIVLVIGVFISILSFVLLPELRTQYYTIFTNDMTHLVRETVNYSGGIKRALSTAANMIIEGSRIALSSYIIFKLRNYKENWLTYFFCIAIILAQFLFINDSNAYVIMVAFSLYMLVYKLFPRYGKLTLRYLVIIVFAFFVLLYINRFSKDIYGTSLSIFLQAYLPGLNNFATIEPLLSRDVFDVIRQIFIDLYAAVPFRSTLFGYKGGLEALPTLWQHSAGLTGQILPNVAQSYYYWGPVLCPILSLILCHIGIKNFKKAETTKNPCLYSSYIYLSLYACISITMYDFYIFMVMLLSRYLFMYLFSYFCKEQMVFNENSENITIRKEYVL